MIFFDDLENLVVVLEILMILKLVLFIELLMEIKILVGLVLIFISWLEIIFV